jgi:hypothetical protein
MARLIDWIFGLFDFRTSQEKLDEEKLFAEIDNLLKTHDVRITKRGTIYSEKKTSESPQEATPRP